jgi:chemotaxis protein MotB
MTSKKEDKSKKNLGFPPPGEEEITPLSGDGDEDSHLLTWEDLLAETDPSEEPAPEADVQADEWSNSLLVYNDKDTFFHSSMPKEAHWSVPWSDLMMTMFILFAVMYIYQSANREFLSSEEMGKNFNSGLKSASAISREGMRTDGSRNISNLYDMSKKTLRARNLNQFASVDLITDKAVRIILTGDLLFDAGKAELKPEAREKLEKIAPILRKTPYMANVVGHTDNVPIYSGRFATNWELSAVRASVVARFFIEEMNIPARKFYLSGHSYYQPIMPNTTDRNRAANRRVEIIITRERPYGTPINTDYSSHSDYQRGLSLSSAGGVSLSNNLGNF